MCLCLHRLYDFCDIIFLRLRRHPKARVIHSLPQSSECLEWGAKMNKQRISKTTIAPRIRRGWTKEEAENTPLLCEKILTLESVLEVEKQGLSINKSAYILGVSMPKLWRFIKKNKIQWSGKNPCFRKNEANPDSTSQRIKRSGICRATIYYRINVMGLTLEQAIERGSLK